MTHKSLHIELKAITDEIYHSKTRNELGKIIHYLTDYPNAIRYQETFDRFLASLEDLNPSLKD